MGKACLAWVFGAVMAFLPSSGFGEEAAAQKAYDDCIVRYADRSTSPQAAVILQRACFFKYRYARDAASGIREGAEQRKLARIYTPSVCDCILEKMPAAQPGVSAPMVLDACVKASKTPAQPVAP
ncbi:MAG: hypothetical protein ACM3KE_12850 [Hyphomicrobiales bacterium]